ncbi:MAG: hypothetical protein ABW110_06715 [Steroidobacteraceae bacterium]
MTKRLCLAAAVACALAQSAHAAGIEDIFSLRGYGTFGVAHSDNDEADVVNDLCSQEKGVGYTDSWSTRLDSKSALQIDMHFTDRLSGVVQLVSESLSNKSWDGDINEEWVPTLEWANLSYKVTDELTVRAGRVVLPFLMSAEYSKVGFANHWMRGPTEVYGQMPFASMDGGDVSYKQAHGDSTSTVRASYGGLAYRSYAFLAQVQMKTLSYTLEKGPLTARAAYMGITFRSIHDLGLSPNYQQFANTAAALNFDEAADVASEVARTFRHTWYPSKWYTVGATYDPGAWFVLGELVHSDQRRIPSDYTTGYVSGGVRMGKLTPYATFSKVEFDKEDHVIPTAGMPAELAGFADALNTALDGAFTGDRSQQTLSVGLRWDVYNGFALKAQYDHVMLDDNSLGLFANRQPGFDRGGNTNVVGLSVDFVF